MKRVPSIKAYGINELRVMLAKIHQAIHVDFSLHEIEREIERRTKPSLRAIKREYNAGYDSGLLNRSSELLCSFNQKKMEIGRKNEFPLVRVYWQGYYDAVNNFHRNTTNYGLNPIT